MSACAWQTRPAEIRSLPCIRLSKYTPPYHAFKGKIIRNRDHRALKPKCWVALESRALCDCPGHMSLKLALCLPHSRRKENHIASPVPGSSTRTEAVSGNRGKRSLTGRADRVGKGRPRRWGGWAGDAPGWGPREPVRS